MKNKRYGDRVPAYVSDAVEVFFFECLRTLFGFGNAPHFKVPSLIVFQNRVMGYVLKLIPTLIKTMIMLQNFEASRIIHCIPQTKATLLPVGQHSSVLGPKQRFCMYFSSLVAFRM